MPGPSAQFLVHSSKSVVEPGIRKAPGLGLGLGLWLWLGLGLGLGARHQESAWGCNGGGLGDLAQASGRTPWSGGGAPPAKEGQQP